MNTTLPTYFLSHGGGPWPWMTGSFKNGHAELAKSLQHIQHTLPTRPKAVLMITAHWEEEQFTLSSAAAPGMLYDYGGFPEHTYRVQYPALGHPELASEIQHVLSSQGIAAQLEPHRGYDHGTFVVLSQMYPKADVPLVQMSLRNTLNPQEHIALGQALAPLRQQGVLILGSGMSFHNMRLFNAAGEKASRAFDDWLQDTMTHCTPEERVNRLLHWHKAPAAQLAHPREEHLMPLMVILGCAIHEVGTCIYRETDFLNHLTLSSFRLGQTNLS